MTEQEMLIEMLKAQDAHNTTIKADWKDQNYPFYRAIWMECAELLSHHNWKWWKKETTNKSQMLLELVDIWHFGLSDMLMKYPEETIIFKYDNHASVFYDLSLEESIEQLVANTIQYRNFEFSPFFQVVHALDASFKDIYDMYKAKNILNQVRQENGYKEGTYKKIWNGKEDNEVLAELVAKKTSLKKLKSALEGKYPKDDG